MLHKALSFPVNSVNFRTLVIIAGALAGAAEAGVDDTKLSATVIDGVSVYSPRELFSVYRDQLGRPITRDSARAILAQIEALYQRDGYSRPELQVDDDLVENGVLRVEVFEAQITQVIFSGDAGPYTQQLQSWADELRSAVPLRTAQLQAVLQKMRDLPGLTIRPATRRDDARRNAYALTIDIKYKPVDLILRASNRGTEEIGPVFAFGQLVANNLLGWRERAGLLFSSAMDTTEYYGGGLFFDAPVTAQDTHITVTTFASRSNPTEEIDHDDRYLRERTSLRVTQPFDVPVGRSVALTAGLDCDDLEVFRSQFRFRDERLRVAELGARASGRVGTNSQYALAMQLRQGIDGLGSRLDAKDLAYDPRRADFLAVRMQFTQLTRFAQRWTVRLDALGQTSGYVLPDSERYKIGGERLGRGFEVSEIAGDQGIGAKAELRRDLTGTANATTRTSLYGFYDFAAAWKQDMPGHESAATSGLGLAFEYGPLGGSVEVARPLTHADVEGRRNTKVFAELRLKL
jgi:hemolysin activation/secretion protein